MSDAMERDQSMYSESQPVGEASEGGGASSLHHDDPADFVRASREQENPAGTSQAELEPTVHSATVETREARKPVIRELFPSERHFEKHPQSRFVSLQKWEGVVEEVDDETFAARLVDLTTQGQDEIAELEIADVSKDDRRLLEPGAVFYWNIGYYTTPDGQRQRSSHLRFRRLPTWRRSELKHIRERAETLKNSVTWR